MLILGAAGGVGVAAVQISKVLGAKVVAVARGESKAKLLKELGADAVIDTSANHQVILPIMLLPPCSLPQAALQCALTHSWCLLWQLQRLV